MVHQVYWIELNILRWTAATREVKAKPKRLVSFVINYMIMDLL